MCFIAKLCTFTFSVFPITIHRWMYKKYLDLFLPTLSPTRTTLTYTPPPLTEYDGEYTPPTARSPDFSDPNHQKNKIVLSPKC